MQMPIFRSVVNLLPLFINAHRPPFAFHLGRWSKQVRNNYSTAIGGERAYVAQETMEIYIAIDLDSAFVGGLLV